MRRIDELSVKVEVKERFRENARSRLKWAGHVDSIGMKTWQRV